MKNKFRIPEISFLILALLLIQSCKKSEDNFMKDVDGNVYTSVTIGTQVWMVENLKTTKYNDGTSIPNVTDNTEWENLTTNAYCWYDNDEATYKGTYGALYNWYTVNTLKLCPIGWHVPSDEEWTTLTNYLKNNGNGYGGNGDYLGKSMAATSGWNISTTAGNVGNDQPSNNSSGFTALPGGYRYYDGTFDGIGGLAYWWGSTEGSITSAYNRGVLYGMSDVGRGNFTKVHGFSVRCLRD